VARAATKLNNEISDNHQRAKPEEKQCLDIKFTPSEALATFRYPAHSVPKATNLFIKA
jgi:hypothetical protein